MVFQRTVAVPPCPLGHSGRVVSAGRLNDGRLGKTRQYRFRWDDGDVEGSHYFTHLYEPAEKFEELSTRDAINAAIPRPVCPVPGHEGRVVTLNGSFATAAGQVQRYQCGKRVDKNREDNERHTFTQVLPRSMVVDTTCCADCRVPTPKNAGTEAASRRLPFPAHVVYTVLCELGAGKAYTATSMKALELAKRPTGRVRRVRDESDPARPLVDPATLNAEGKFSPKREQKAHWHISADLMERLAPIVTEPLLARLDEEIAQYRQTGLPVVYFADDAPVKRSYARSATLTSSAQVWTALVVSRTQWERNDPDDPVSPLVSRKPRLLRVRPMPTNSAEAWTLVFSELPAPDFLVCDGAGQIANAANAVWGDATTIVPYLYHATTNIKKHLRPSKGKLPDKVRDHCFALTREYMAGPGPDRVSRWFDELAVLAAACDLPADVVAAQREQYEPLLDRSAAVAQVHQNPEVQVSHTAVEKQIHEWVDPVTSLRGPMFANLPRTALLGDLIVAGANGALADRHQVIDAIRDHSRQGDGWSPPPRALVEPAGAMSLRDASSVTELAERAKPKPKPAKSRTSTRARRASPSATPGRGLPRPDRDARVHRGGHRDDVPGRHTRGSRAQDLRHLRRGGSAPERHPPRGVPHPGEPGCPGRCPQQQAQRHPHARPAPRRRAGHPRRPGHAR